MNNKNTKTYIVFKNHYGETLEQISSILTSKKQARELIQRQKNTNKYTTYYILKVVQTL